MLRFPPDGKSWMGSRPSRSGRAASTGLDLDDSGPAATITPTGGWGPWVNGDPYPPTLAKALVGYFLFEAKFSLRNAHKNVDRNDVTYLARCCFRCIACLRPVIFALIGKYLINDKSGVDRAEQFERCPTGFDNRVAGDSHEIGSGVLSAAPAIFNALFADTVALRPYRTTLVKGPSGSGTC